MPSLKPAVRGLDRLSRSQGSDVCRYQRRKRIIGGVLHLLCVVCWVLPGVAPEWHDLGASQICNTEWFRARYVIVAFARICVCSARLTPEGVTQRRCSSECATLCS